MTSPEVEYWFARRYPMKAMRSGMAPVHTMGWVVSAAYLLALAASAAVGVWFADRGGLGEGLAAFGVFSLGATLGYVRVVHTKGDHIRCVADYREEKARA